MLWLAMLVPLGVSAFGHLAWLDYLYIVSYVKLVVTPIKYIPQVSWTCNKANLSVRSKNVACRIDEGQSATPMWVIF